WLPVMPKAAKAKLPATDLATAKAVYFPACVNRIFGDAAGGSGGPSLPEALVAVSQRAWVPLWIPKDVAGNCCATFWHSKGYHQGNVWMANHVVESLWRWSREGALSIVVDATSCTHGLVDDVKGDLTEENRERHSRLRILDAVAWVHDEVLPRLVPTRKVASVVLHPGCSAQHLGLSGKLQAIANVLADEVLVPVHAGCCGFAGDRGFLHPELTRAATADEAAEVAGRTFSAYLGTNRMCEVGMQSATGAQYRSFVYLLEE